MIIGKLDAFDEDQVNKSITWIIFDIFYFKKKTKKGSILFEILNDEHNNFSEIIEVHSRNGFLTIKNNNLLDFANHDEINFQVNDHFLIFIFIALPIWKSKSILKVIAKEESTIEKYTSDPVNVRIVLSNINEHNNAYIPPYESSWFICEMNPFNKNFYLNDAVYFKIKI